jgi:hypothetical protein
MTIEIINLLGFIHNYSYWFNWPKTIQNVF